MATPSQTFQKGDILMEFGTAYQVLNIKDQTNLNEEKEPHIFYKPYFPNDRNQTIICSLPMSNLDEPYQRKPLTQKAVHKLLDSLAGRKSTKSRVNLNKAKDKLKSNDPHKIARLAKRLWLEKQDPELSFPMSRRAVYEQTLKQLTQEVAVVLDLDPKKARKKILSALRKT